MSVPGPKGPVRIANCSGFYGDRLAAPREMLEGPDPIDVLTGDYLAELTMLILWKARQKDPGAGYATTFVRQMEDVLGTCLDRGVKVVTNAGGLNPRGLAARLDDLAGRLGLAPRIAVVEGDDILDRLADLQAAGETLAHADTGQPLAAAGVEPVTANAYLGGWGISAALSAGADVVVCPRVTDASLVSGPAAWWHGWDRGDWDRIAGAVVAGHVIECGPQATGGNYSLLAELPDDRYPGFPIAEVAHDGSSVITKQPGTGGAVTIGTVTAQLLYEIAEPAYANPDVIARFDTIGLHSAGDDRVLISGVAGRPPPPRLKVAINYPGGYRNTMTMVITGLDIEAKAARAEAMLWQLLGGRDQFAAVDVRLIRSDQPDPATNEQATAQLRVTVKDPDPARGGPALLQRGDRTEPGQLQRLLHHHAPVHRERLRRVLADLRTGRSGHPHRGRARRSQPGHSPQPVDADRPGRHRRAGGRRRPVRADRPPAPRHALRCPLRRQGRQCQCRRVDVGRSGLRLAARLPRHPTPSGPHPGGGRSRGAPLRAPQPARPQLCHRRPARRGRGLFGAQRSSGQGLGRVPAVALRRGSSVAHLALSLGCYVAAMSVRLSEEEAWEMLGSSHTGILTTLRRDGFPVTLPVWFVTEDRTVLVAGPGLTKKFSRVRHDGRASFLVESGYRWAELKAVQLTGRAEIVDDPDWEHIDALLDAKYKGARTPRAEMPESARARYDSARSLIRIVPETRILSWDNARLDPNRGR